MDRDQMYRETEAIIEDLVRVKKHKYAMRHFGPEDIAQEVRIKCWKSLEKYTPDKGNIKTFLNVITENHLKNVIRDNFATFNPPNKRNPEYFDKNGKPTDKALKCPKTSAYLKMFRLKQSVRLPTSVDGAYKSTAEGIPIQSLDIEVMDLDFAIRKYLRGINEDYVDVYDKMKSGEKVPRNIASTIKTLLTEFLENEH